MGRIRRLVLDTLKPHDPTIIELAQSLSELEGVEAVIHFEDPKKLADISRGLGGAMIGLEIPTLETKMAARGV